MGGLPAISQIRKAVKKNADPRPPRGGNVGRGPMLTTILAA